MSDIRQNLEAKGFKFVEYNPQQSKAAAKHRSQNPKLSTIDYMEKYHKLIVGIPGNYAPFADIYANNPDGSLELWGLDINNILNIVPMIATDLNLGDIAIEFVKTDWPYLSTDLNNSCFDIAIGGIQITPLRQQQHTLTNGYLENGKCPLIRSVDKSKPQFESINSMLQTEAINFAVNPGGTNYQWITKHLPKGDTQHRRIIKVAENNDIHPALARGYVHFEQLAAESIVAVEQGWLQPFADDKFAIDVFVTDKYEALMKVKYYPEWNLCALQAEHLLEDSAGHMCFLLRPQESLLADKLNRHLAMVAHVSNSLIDF